MHRAPSLHARSTSIALAAALVAGGCGGGSSTGSGTGSTSTSSSTTAGSTSSSTTAASTSSSTTAGSSSSSGGMDAGVKSTLPVPPGSGDVPRPSGTAANLKVLDWAGFKAAVSYTFDDAQPSQIEHYADLEAAGVPMTFYVTSGNSAEPMFDATFSQAVKDGHEIGNHTVNHCQASLSGCSTGATPAGDTVDKELDQCDDYIVQHFGQSAVWTGASPFGDTGYDSYAQQRFFVYRGVGGGLVAPNDNTDPFNLPCHVAAANETTQSFNTFTDAAHTAGSWSILLVHSILPTTATWYNPVQIADVTGTMAYAKSLGDVWIDTVANVGAYWRAQAIVSALTPTTAGTQQTWTWTLPGHFPPGRYLRVTVGGGTLSQAGAPLSWDGHGYYEVALDAGSLTWSP